MKKELLTLFCVAGISFPALGGTYNIAPKARATASSSLNADGDASKVNDGYIPVSYTHLTLPTKLEV